MIVVAGPPGSGKSTLFPVSTFGIDFFNADDRAAELNAGSYKAIPLGARERANREFEAFVDAHIRDRVSFAIETTLRTRVTFEQAGRAARAGFRLEMLYLGLRDFDLHVTRVVARALAGGHAAPADRLREIHERSLRNLPEALRRMDRVQVFDNSGAGSPEFVMETERGAVTFRAPRLPGWLEDRIASGW